MFKMFVCIQPDGWHDAMAPDRAPLDSCSVMFFLGNITREGIKSPPALIQEKIVTGEPLCVDIRYLICFSPFRPIA